MTRADETDTVAIGVLYIHFSGAPGLVNRAGVNSDALLDQFRVESIHIVHLKSYNAAGNPVPRKGRNVQPRAVAHKPHIAEVVFALINSIGEFPPESQPPAIERFPRYRAINMQHTNRN